MSNYYRYSSALGSSNSRRSSTPGWLWLFTGLLLGVGVAYYAYWQGKGTITPTVQAQTVGPLSMKPAPSAKDAPKTGDSAVTTKPAATAGIDANFDFYTILPEMQMAVPEPIVAPTPVTIAKVVTPVITTPLQLKPEANTKLAEPEQAKALGGYILQVGAFRQQREANGLKARLAMLGVDAKIQTVTNNRNTVHRVRIGPLNDLGKINTLRSRLHGSNINAVVLKISS